MPRPWTPAPAVPLPSRSPPRIPLSALPAFVGLANVRGARRQRGRARGGHSWPVVLTREKASVAGAVSLREVFLEACVAELVDGAGLAQHAPPVGVVKE